MTELLSVATFSWSPVDSSDFWYAIFSGGMALLLIQLHPLFVNLFPLARLLVEIASGGIAYVSGMTIMWLLARRAEGAEAYLLKNILHIRGQAKAQ
jgi:hypothetical protein